MTTVRIADITNQIRGVSYKPSDVKDGQINGAKPILRANNITPEGLVFDDLVWIDEKVISKQQLLQKFDIVIAASSGSKSVIGKASQLCQSWEGSFGAFCKVLRPKIEKVDPKYIYYFFQTKEYRTTVSALAAGANINNLRNEHLDNLQIPLPPLPIQKKIVAILDKADSLRQKDKQLLEHYNKLAQSIFYDMFGDPVRNEKGWKFEVVENLLINKNEGTKCGPFGSALKRDEYVESGIPVWVMDNIDEINFIDRPFLHISDDKYRDLKSYEVKNGDIIVSRAGTVGKMAVVQSEASTSIISTNLIKVSLDRNLASPYYFVYLMKLHGEKFGRLKKGRDGAFTHMNTGIIRSLMIPLPDIKTQKKFEHILTSLRTQNDFLEVSRAKSETFFQSLLNKAFKGELVKES